MVGQGQIISKLHFKKRPKAVPKSKIFSRKYIIQKLIFGVYLYISDFLAESVKANRNWQKRPLNFI